MNRILRSALVFALLGAAASARADITIGIDLSTTGSAAAIGIPSKNAVQLWPDQIGGQKARYIILDDATDPTNAVTNVKKLIADERVDAIVGPNITPSAIAVIDAVSEGQTPLVALAASAAIIEPQSDPRRKWVFKMPQNDALMVTAVTEHMRRAGIKTLGFIGFNDAYGESWSKELTALVEKQGVKLVANERFVRTDTSVTGQILKIMSAKPDAVFIAASGTPAALPQRTLVERGYAGKIYQTHGIATPDFLRVAGKEAENTLFPTGPSVVAGDLPDSHPVKKAAVDFVTRYEKAYGAGTSTQFAADAWGAWQLLDDATSRALKTGAKPGTVEFRRALRDALESTANLTVPNGVLNLSAKDHQGFDERARVMGVVKNGKFTYATEQ